MEQDISKIEPGSMITIEWRGKPVWLINRTQEMLDTLPKLAGELTDPNLDVPQQPDYCKNPTRSRKPNLMVLLGICTHLGCSPTSKLKQGEEGMGSEWPGGFFCPCHGSKFDLAGRVFKGSPAPINLEVPPYYYMSDTRLLVGEDGKGA